MKMGGSALEEARSCGGKTVSEGTRKAERSGRNGSPTGNDGKVSARPTTMHREMAAKGEKVQRKRNECE